MDTGEKPPARNIVQAVADILGVEKISWSRAVKACNQALKDGFEYDDFIQAANNMAKGDKRYHSIYSVFVKTDYWMGLSNNEPSVPKGVW